MNPESTAALAGDPDYLDNELPGRHLPNSWEINQQLFGEPAATKPKMRIWLSGTIVYEPRLPGQGQPFADWELSSLNYELWPDDAPPPGYEGVSTVQL